MMNSIDLAAQTLITVGLAAPFVGSLVMALLFAVWSR